MKRLFAIGLLVAASFLGGCGRPDATAKFQLTDVTGANFGKELALTDHNGRPRTLVDFKGKVVVLFFGFIHCPDVCPTTLADMAKVKQKLGAQGEQLQVLLVTLDPKRDTPAVLSQYVPGFDL